MQTYHLDVAESKYSIEQTGVSVTFYGGELDGITFNDATTVKKYARKASLGRSTRI